MLFANLFFHLFIQITNRPETLRKEYPEVEQTARWVRAVHDYAIQLMEAVRSGRANKAGKVRQSPPVKSKKTK